MSRVALSDRQRFQSENRPGRCDPSPITAISVDDRHLAIGNSKNPCLDTARADVGGTTDGIPKWQLVGDIRPNAVVLEISVPGLSGHEVAKAIAASEHCPLVAFATMRDNRANAAFSVALAEPMRRPIVSAGMTQAITPTDSRSKAVPTFDGPQSEFWVPYRGATVRVVVDDIRRIHAERDYVRLFTADGSYLVRATLTGMLERPAASGFVRIHRSIAVAKRHIAAFRHAGSGAWVTVDPDGCESPIGRSFLAKVREDVGLISGNLAGGSR